MFVDQVTVTLSAGKGGNGCLSFRREKGIPKGGPDGGRGGNGGDVFFRSKEGLTTLAFFRFHPINKAKKGSHGEGGNRQGKQGEDLTLEVPVGTIIRDDDSGRLLFDFTAPGQTYLAAQGGRGGKGNASYATSTNRAPRKHQEGQPGEEKVLILELKLIADAGLVGFPNSGKSTLISKVSAARPVIADYPFTTLVPNLGVVDLGEYKSFMIADIPGLIEGAHKGQGLGINFLKHVERTKVLIHIIDVSPYTDRDPVEDFYAVLKELEAFNPNLCKRAQVIVANKIDLLGSQSDRLEKVKKLAQKEHLPFYPISALRKQGLKELIYGIEKILKESDPERYKYE
ncbi:MAG: GTPase ObgE [Candidatus Aminicenantes bacterium]|nr:GTPase ObgE [Candidatus Aminicenantes bacterium]